MKKILLALFLLALFTQKASAQTVPTPPPDIKEIVENASAFYGISIATVEAVIYCESEYNPNAIGDQGTSYGISQIHAPAHPDISIKNMLDPYFSIFYLAWNLSHGYGNMWTCYRKLSTV